MSKRDLPEILLSEFESGCGPYALYFVYCKSGKSMVIKGNSVEVDEYVRANCGPCLLRYTYWKDGQSRGGWMFMNCTGKYVSKDFGDNKWTVTIFDNDRIARKLRLKRIPHKWIPEFDDV